MTEVKDKPPVATTPPQDNNVTARNIFDLANEPTEVKTPGTTPASATEWKTPEEKKKEETTAAAPPEEKYSDDYYKLSGKNTARMGSELFTTGLKGLNHWLMKRKLNRIMEEEDFIKLELKKKNLPDKVTEEEKSKLEKIKKTIEKSEKVETEIEWQEDELDGLSESFYEYQKYTKKPLPPWIMIVFNFCGKMLHTVNVYIFS